MMTIAMGIIEHIIIMKIVMIIVTVAGTAMPIIIDMTIHLIIIIIMKMMHMETMIIVTISAIMAKRKRLRITR